MGSTESPLKINHQVTARPSELEKIAARLICLYRMHSNDEHVRRPSVLLIDDEPEFARLMDRALRDDFTVTTAADGLDGYALLCQDHPDVVLLDVMMPLIDGWSVLQKIRSNRAVSNVPVIVVTGLGAEAAVHESIRHGVTRILHKPILPSRLIKEIREALNISRRSPPGS
jgi:DNA-binding response OmpR family regulator